MEGGRVKKREGHEEGRLESGLEGEGGKCHDPYNGNLHALQAVTQLDHNKLDTLSDKHVLRDVHRRNRSTSNNLKGANLTAVLTYSIPVPPPVPFQ